MAKPKKPAARAGKEPIVHALLLPAPLHNPMTPCGISLSGETKPPKGSQVLGVKGPDPRITCVVCQVSLRFGDKNPPADLDHMMTVSKMEVDPDGQSIIAIDVAQEYVQILATAFSNAMREARAENYLMWTWALDFGSPEQQAEWRKNNPDEDIDSVEIITYCRRKDGLKPEDLASRRKAEIDAAWEALEQEPNGSLADAIARLRSESR